MITFSILLTIILIVAVVIATCGAGLIVALGDLIVCGLILWLIFKLFSRKDKKKDEAQ